MYTHYNNDPYAWLVRRSCGTCSYYGQDDCLEPNLKEMINQAGADNPLAGQLIIVDTVAKSCSQYILAKDMEQKYILAKLSTNL